MLGVGDEAPGFELVGYHDGDITAFSLDEQLAAGNSVLLTFYVFDFAPHCTREMCDIQDANWYGYKNDLQVFGINRDGVFSHQRFAEENDLEYPLLSDVSGEVCRAYDALFDEFEGIAEAPRRSVFLVDEDGTVQYVWRTDDNNATPEMNPIQEAIRAL